MNTTAHQIAQADQVQAAANDARRLLDHAAEQEGTTLHTTVTDPWILAQAQGLRDALQFGAVRACRHLANGPGIGHAAVWRPGFIVCPACTPLLVPKPKEDSTCDRCRRHAHDIYAGAITVGPILLGYGLCRSCASETGLASQDKEARP